MSLQAEAVTEGLHRELGLTDDELHLITQRLGRSPTLTELAMFSVMWSEHCSYKSSRSLLKTLPTTGDHILLGPGEGAGIIEVAPGVAVAWKAESHNHPSFVEPFNGAATGVGGIVRDILSMGARPIALLDPLRFGDADAPKTRYLIDGIVGGISAYGNSIGVPTVGGETIFEDCYTGNPLVNVACLGVVETRLMHGRAEGAGNIVILVGSSTGRDGIGGASVLASAEFEAGSDAKRPSVQVGDPFAEKLLIEVCLELISRDLVVSMQDLGAGGISCPASEMSAKAGTGMRVDVGAVHRREPHMTPFEVMISESQERMMVVAVPERAANVLEVCERWGISASIIGEVTDSGRLDVVDDGVVVAGVPAVALADEAPVYERPRARPGWLDALQKAAPGDRRAGSEEDALLELLSSPEHSSKRWLWEQYDYMVMLGTLQGPGGDAAVIRLPGSDVSVALSVDGPGRYCYLDPYEGARLAVAEAARNVACVGATPLAITNCLNFGNPERPEVMWQFAEVVRGMGDACSALGTPVTGGNVSFYNETAGQAIYPTPVIGMLGSLPAGQAPTGIGFSGEDDIVLLGVTRPEDFGGSDYAKVMNDTIAGLPPRLDIHSEKALHGLLTEACRHNLLSSAHDLSSGGLAVGLAESSLCGDVGFSVAAGAEPAYRWFFSESPSRAVVSCLPEKTGDLEQLARERQVPMTAIGRTGGGDLDFGTFRLRRDAARAAWDAS